jgi:biopolymer transport protein ExbD
MADVNTGDSGGGKHGKKRAKKSSTKIDMTPMVDLAFLLLTFFMLTTTFSKPQTMEINMPVKDGENTPVAASTAMTIILSEQNKIYYYFGIEKPTVELTNFGPDGIRKVLLERNSKTIQQVDALKNQFETKKFTEADKVKEEKALKQQINKIKGDKNALMVLIKTDDKAKYKNVVDILDEMSICNIGKYALVDVTPVELKLIKESNK